MPPPHSQDVAPDATPPPTRCPCPERADLPEPAAVARDRHEACLDRCEHAPPCIEHYFNLAEPYQFHLNIAGMGFCRVRMRRAAMTYEAEPRDFPGIPEYKFLSTGPWLVSAREVREALERYDTAPSGLRAELECDALWRDWVEWLRQTTEHGGFTVN